MDPWMSKCCPSFFPFFFPLPFKLMAFLSLFQEQKHILAKPDCQEDKFLFSGWVGLLEKFHFNWKMDSFTSWHGFLGQHSTTPWLPSSKWWRGLQWGKSCLRLEDLRTSEDKLSVLINLRHTPFFPKGPDPGILLIPSLERWVFVPILWAYLGICSLTCSLMQVSSSISSH